MENGQKAASNVIHVDAELHCVLCFVVDRVCMWKVGLEL